MLGRLLVALIALPISNSAQAPERDLTPLWVRWSSSCNTRSTDSGRELHLALASSRPFAQLVPPVVDDNELLAGIDRPEQHEPVAVRRNVIVR